MVRRYHMLFLVVLFVMMQGCGSNNSTGPTGSATGAVSVSLTDAPAFGFDHVWVTVRDLWLHTSETAEPVQTGWVKLPLSAPVTLDLLSLGNGNISVPVWDNIGVPEGAYTQIRIFLVRTEAALADSAKAENPSLIYNNQVDVSGDSSYPLRVPDAEHGIMLTGQFTVRKNEKLKLAIDFDAGHDVVNIGHDGRTEYILKPRLAYFDLQNAGAIVGSLDSQATGSNPSAQFVIKAEQVAPNGLVHVVRRVTVLAPDDSGRFVLFPLQPGIYDVVIRGVNYETTIIKGVAVTKDTKPDLNPTVIPRVTMIPSSAADHPLDVTIASPTGAWVDFFQTLPGAGELPYEIRFRHFNPLNGHIIGFPVSSDPLRVGTFAGDTPITFETVSPVGGSGSYKAVAGAPLHNIDLSKDIISSDTSTLQFDTLDVVSPLADRTVTGSIRVPETFAPGFLDRGVLFACHGGMIVNAINVNDEMISGGTYTISNLPGGSPDRPLPGAYYGIEAFGWSSSNPANRAIAAPKVADLTTGDAAGVDLTMEMLLLP
jgi:hypothetical protein